MEKASRLQKVELPPQAVIRSRTGLPSASLAAEKTGRPVAASAPMKTTMVRMTANRKASGSQRLTTRTQPLVNFLNILCSHSPLSFFRNCLGRRKKGIPPLLKPKTTRLFYNKVRKMQDGRRKIIAKDMTGALCKLDNVHKRNGGRLGEKRPKAAAGTGKGPERRAPAPRKAVWLSIAARRDPPHRGRPPRGNGRCP